MALPIEYIRQPRQLKATIDEILSNTQIAVDTEANSRHKYPEQLCVIQIATPRKIYIIDPIVLDNTDLLEPIFSRNTITKIFHTAEYDIRSLNKHLGFTTKSAYDVAIAAQFIGISKFALSNILKEFLGISIKKNRKIQEGDWGIRPISREAIDYAADDVRYLLLLKEYCDKKLLELNRTEWVKEECMLLEDLHHEPVDPDYAFLRVKNAQNLDNNGRAILKSLFRYREKEAIRQNRPPNYLIPDVSLIYLANNPEANFSDVPELNERRIQKFGLGIEDALIVGLNSEPILSIDDEQESQDVIDEEGKLRLLRLREWRDTTADSLSLSSSLIWPNESLKRLAKDPNIFEDEILSSEVRRWQRNQFSSSLSTFLKSITTSL